MSVVRMAMTKAALKSPLVCVGFCLMGLAIASPVAFAEGSLALGGTGGSPLESPLVVPGALPLTGSQSVEDAEEAQRTGPEAVLARQQSQTKYEGLDTEEASKLAGETFPGMVDHPAGGLPQLPEGQRITNIIGANAAQVSLPQGQSGHAVLESIEPIATESSPGRWSPVDLSVSEAGGLFQVANLAVGVSIPKRLQDGVSLADSGVSLTPVDASGAAMGGSEGRVDGSVVFYGGVGVGSDVDEVVKPEPSGFSEDAILRSVASPGRLVYRVGLPEDAGLVQASDGSGAVNVVEDGEVIATIPAPHAQDATGVDVPVTMSVEGDLLVLNVAKGTGYADPILVDPVVDEFFTKEGKGNGKTTNWHFVHEGIPKDFEGLESHNTWLLTATSNHHENEWGALEYTTQGESKIGKFELNEESHRVSGGKVEDLMEVVSRKGEAESKITLPEGSSPRETETVSGSAGNSAEVLMTATHAGEKEDAELVLSKGAVTIEQSKGPEVSIDTTHEYVDGGKRNVFYGSGGWLGATSGAFEFHAKDPGVGIFTYAPKVEKGEVLWSELHNRPEEGECSGFQCSEEFSKGYTYNSKLLNGEETLTVSVTDVTVGEAKVTKTLKVDTEPPHGITLSGLPSNHEIDEGQHLALKASATDGVSPTPSSGIASIVLEVDGQSISGPQGYCSPGPCTGNAEWALSAENYAAGEHTLTVVATDNAGNVATEEYHLTVHHAEGVAVGPGSVNPVTGELSLAATDVSVGVPGGALTVARSYRSRHLAQGAEGPLGPQWNLSLGAQQSLLRVSGGMILTGSSGEQIVFESKGKGEFTSPTGDAGLVLLEKTVESKTVFMLSENGSVTTFEIPSGGSGVWMPSSVEGPNGTNATLYKFKVEGGVIEPKEELAPVPAGISCGKEISELKEGCRALKFEYAIETKAKGEKASEWSEFAGHLSKVKYIAWNASKTKTETVVAEYAYDSKGRLRAEWNPTVTPSPLKTTYGYDIEGHVTAVSTPGHEPALLEQGTIPSDASPGRLLAVAVPSAATALGTGEAPVNKEVPTLSSTKPAVGTKISVNLTSEKTPGAWSGGPLAFIYQWEDCNSSGKECSPIPSAVNQAYYPVAGDEGHKLVAEAIALNATGAVTASSEATATVTSGTPNTPLPEPPAVGSDAVTTLEYLVPLSGSGAPYEMSSTELAKWGQTDDPSEAMAIFPPDKVMGWPAKEYKRETVYYLDGKDRAVNVGLPTGGISTSEYNLYNDVIRTLTPDNRLKAITEGCKANEECKSATENTYEEKGSEPGTELLSTLGPQHTVKLASGKEGKVNEEAQARERTNYYYNEGAPTEGGPYHLVTKTIDSAETASKAEFDERTTTTSYSGQEGLGWKLRKPTSVTTNPGGLNLVHTTLYEAKTGNVIETRMPAAGKGNAPGFALSFGKQGSGHGEFKYPIGIAASSSGNIWVGDQVSDRVQEFNSNHEYVRQFGKSGTKEGEELKEPEGIATNAAGDVYVVDSENNRVQEFSPEGKFIRMFGFGVSNGETKAEVCMSSCQDGVSGSGEGQFKTPAGITVDSSGNVWVADAGNDRVEEFSETGTYLKKFGSEGTGESEFKHPTGITISGGNLYVVDEGNNRVEEFSPTGSDTELGHFGKGGSGNGEFSSPNWITTEPTSGNLYVVDWGHGRVEEFTASGGFVATFGSKGSGEGQFEFPKAIAVDSYGDVYVVDRGNYDVEEWVPGATGNEGAHDTKTIYYTNAANSEYSACGEHPAMANLPCETTPAAQPGTSGLPELPVTKYVYNIWDEPETATETVGSTTRTRTDTYDAVGRLKTGAISSTVGTALPTITDEYNSATGVLEKQGTTTEGKTKTITSVANKLGQLENYTDAAEDKTTYEYDIDGRIKKVNDEKGTETYTYSETTGLPTELLNEYSGTKLTFTATYDAEGNMLTESYPNGMTATYSYNQVGKPTNLVYKKTTHCTEEEKEKCKWFKDSVTPSIHGQWLEQTSTLSHQTYTYDDAGRLTQVQNTPAGKDCTTRIYAYDEDTNRTSLTTGESSTEKCTTEGGKIQKHTYDAADRLTDPGIAYNTFGDITTLPANDAEASAEHALTNTYYTNSQVASQTQNEQTVGYNLDPAGRTLETVSSGKPNNSTIISHYAGAGNAPAWTLNPVSSEWRRNITGISGSLVAIQNNGETPELQLTNLHGDIVAKAYLSETATELAAKADTSEFGVPTVTAPAKYAWLGASELPTELPSGVIMMGVRSYVPEIGRFLQPDPVPGGSADAYSYTFGDPVNSTDPTGAYVEGAYLNAFNDTQNREAVEREETREAAARAAAEQAAREAAESAAAAAGPQYAEEEEWEEWGEEEGGYEYAAYLQDTHEQEKVHLEEGVLYQPLGEAGATVKLCTEKIKATDKEATDEACAIMYVGIFGEVLGGLKKAWNTLKNGGSHLVHIASNVANWIRQEACEQSNRGAPGVCHYGNRASNCELSGVALTTASFIPADKWLTLASRIGGVVTLAAC